jgi:predicted phosphodiesterase
MWAVNFAVIGDIHYPSSKHSNALDDKIGPPVGVVSALGKSTLSILLDDLIKTNRQRPFDAILFVGDFTTAGKLPEFEEALHYFSKALESLNVPMIAVPGNHDLNKPRAFIDNPGKFQEFIKAASNPEIKIDLSYDLLRSIKGSASSNHVMIYALNSCANCNELWKSDGKQALANYLLNENVSIPDDELYEYFDAPFLDTDAINKIISEMERNEVRLPIILTHHNVLPQKIPRIAIFPELLNAGFVRHSLASASPPVIYIHGHIHDDPVDVIANPINVSQVGLVTISAPLVTAGYTQVKLLLRKDGTPLATSITQKRIDKISIGHSKETAIPFYSRFQMLDIMPSDAKDYLAKIKKSKEERYDRSIRDHGAEFVSYLEIAGLISIQRPTLNAQSTWRVRCAGE